jgi:hypothetical protein
MTNRCIIIRNQIETPDGTILTSHDRHDYKTHRDEITHEIYMVDGGRDYLRRSINNIPAKEQSVTSEDDFELQREAFTWGSYGPNGDQPKHYIKLKDMSASHISAILKTQRQIKGTYVEDLFLKELQYRGMENDGC